MVRVWIGLGSNRDDPPAQLRAAFRNLAAQSGVELTVQSSLYRSAAIGPAGQADYCNAVCGTRTQLAPQALLALLQMLEDRAGRNRGGPRWGPRVLDLDLLLYGGQQVDEPGLKIPHPELHRRNFVLAPLAEVAPGLVVPGRGAVEDLLRELGREGLSLWEPQGR